MRTLVLAGIFILVQASTLAQSLSDLQQKRQNTAKEIEYTTRLLSQVQQEEKASLGRLQLINNNINQRNTLISGLNAEMKLYLESIENNNLAVELLSEDLEKLKTEYAQLIRIIYLNRNVGNQVLFLLSADNFNQAYRRFLYMRRYASFRKEQSATIQLLQKLLHEKVGRLEQLRTARRKLLEEARLETKKLAEEKTRQNLEIGELKRKQQDLKQTLEQQRRVEQQLEREINRIIEEEANKNREAGEPAFALTPEQKLAGANFEQNKQRLPWPVERGIIAERFGIHRHPVLEYVQVRNNGVDIATEPGAKVRAVFDGEVSRVFGITGGNTAVIIRHGQYLSVYSNLQEAVVKKGDRVSTKQVIGTVFTDYEDGNKSVLKFQIWRENQKLNPEEWIGR
jgi:murein DD-endopeptidase MepM/ murein hydrolase activator NlpD